jgi:uncharacterized protein YjbJ (UPF0337 family)
VAKQMSGDKHPFWEVVVGLVWEVWGNVVEDKHPLWEVVVGLVWEVLGNVVEDKARDQDSGSNSKECPIKSEQ